MHLSLQQQATLRALLDRIVPPDDEPGAWDAGVGDYLARQFEADLSEQVEHYRAGLDALSAEALARHGMAFETLAAEQQDALLRAIEAGDTVTAWPLSPESFVGMAARHAAEGYYSDSGNGGNRHERSWAMIGFAQTARARPIL